MKPAAIMLLGAALLAGCAGCPAIRWQPIGGPVTAPVPATCPHQGAGWSDWSEVTIGTLVRRVRVRECPRCGWVQTQSEMRVTTK